MQSAYKKSENDPVSEMAIVNTFTKLIFGDDNYTARELSIIEALRTVDTNVLRDSHLEMGGYLRNLGVREMIQLVSRLHRHIAESVKATASTHRPSARITASASRRNPQPV